MNDVKNTYMKEFGEKDSVLIMNLSQTCKVIRMGYTIHDEENLIIV